MIQWGPSTTCENLTETELKGVVSTGAFVDTSKPAAHKAIGTRLAYRWKLGNLAHVVKAKSRLVENGYSQVEGVDFMATYAPMASLSSIRLLSACVRDRLPSLSP